MEDLKNLKEQFYREYSTNIQRSGADKLLVWLEQADFFEAPASTRFHMACPGGLLQHSLHVHDRLRFLCEMESQRTSGFDMPSSETIAICGLLHDLCKVDFYKVEYRNKKNEQGEWVKVPYYCVEDNLPYGHGEKSVYIISGFMKLTREEAMAIRWHMGGFDDAVKGGSFSLSKAFEQYPLAVLLHIADIEATYLDESNDLN